MSRIFAGPGSIRKGKGFSGARPTACSGKDCWRRFPVWPAAAESWAAAADGGTPLRHELQCLRDGMEGWIAFSVVGVDDGIAMTFRDITACRRDAAAVQEARLKAD